MNNHILIHQTSHILRLWPASLLALLGAGMAAQAGLILDLPDVTLQPNQANQTFTITVQNDSSSGSVQLNGMQLELVIGNGSSGAPAFQAVSLIAPGLLFTGNNTGDRGAGNFGGTGQVFQRLTSTGSGVVTVGPSASVNLATVTFDTTGIGPETISWSGMTSPNGRSFYSDPVNAQIFFDSYIDGTLTVVPEPVSVALPIFGGLVALAGGLRWWCRRSPRACRI